MYKVIKGDLDDVLKDLNRLENGFRVVQIIPVNTGGVVAAILYKEPKNDLETVLELLNKNLEIVNVPWYRRLLRWLRLI